MVQLNQHEWHTDTYRHKVWVGIPENKNVGYKSICMLGKVNKGLLNDIKNGLFQVLCVLTSLFPMTCSRYRLLLLLFHILKSILWTATIITKCLYSHLVSKWNIFLSLVLSKHRKYRAVSQSSLPVPFCLVDWTMLYRFTDYPSIDDNVKQWMVILAWLCRFQVRNFRIWKELKRKLKRAQSSR